MYNFLMVVHVLMAFALIVAIVIFQTSKGSALSMFGGGGDALFNSASGTSFIKKFTMGAAAIFAATSLLLTVMSNSNRMRSVVQQYPLGAPPQAQQAPAPAPGGQPAVPAAAPASPAPVKK
ncbi:MAG: preprotein translocase subunit SecG [Elusimicrobiales bacterium]|jgi:protein translocase SecG subunit